MSYFSDFDFFSNVDSSIKSREISRTPFNKSIIEEDNVYKFIKSLDFLQLMSSHSCLCQSIIRLFALSADVLKPFIKICPKIKQRDLMFISHVNAHLQTIGILESHAYFCTQSKLSDYIIINNICTYASPTLIKERWSCPKCLSCAESYIESKIKIPEKITAILIFTLKGLTSNNSILNQLGSDKDLQLKLSGKFLVKYFVVEENNSFAIYEFFKSIFFILNLDKWRKICHDNFTGKYKYYSVPPFHPKNIRCIVWHHSNPYTAASCYLLASKKTERN
ncbi:hypothetical protein HZS_478, partial [Henneguya salminicola]